VRIGKAAPGETLAPSFSIAVILTLALGIGANSALFSAIDAILLRPLPFPDGDELMELRQYNPKVKSPRTRLEPPFEPRTGDS
jgi:putative ABC transport system permease protein